MDGWMDIQVQQEVAADIQVVLSWMEITNVVEVGLSELVEAMDRIQQAGCTQWTVMSACHLLPHRKLTQIVVPSALEPDVLQQLQGECLHADQDRQIEAKVVQGLRRLLAITNHTRITCTTPYNPKSDGMVECFNRTLIDQLAKTGLWG